MRAEITRPTDVYKRKAASTSLLYTDRTRKSGSVQHINNKHRGEVKRYGKPIQSVRWGGVVEVCWTTVVGKLVTRTNRNGLTLIHLLSQHQLHGIM